MLGRLGWMGRGRLVGGRKSEGKRGVEDVIAIFTTCELEEKTLLVRDCAEFSLLFDLFFPPMPSIFIHDAPKRRDHAIRKVRLAMTQNLIASGISICTFIIPLHRMASSP